MSNDPVPCVECDCVLIVKDVTDEFSLVCSKLQLNSSFCLRDLKVLLAILGFVIK